MASARFHDQRSMSMAARRTDHFVPFFYRSANIVYLRYRLFVTQNQVERTRVDARGATVQKCPAECVCGKFAELDVGSN